MGGESGIVDQKVEKGRGGREGKGREGKGREEQEQEQEQEQ